MSLKNKKILVTGGPTWVALDSVRVISNTATGKNGVLISKELAKHGAKVTLILGPCAQEPKVKGIQVIRFSFFDELRNILKKLMKKKRFDVMIHSASVSDYRPIKMYTKKVSSELKSWSIKLKPTPKIIEEVRALDPGMLLVGFKYEPNATKHNLLTKTKAFLKRSKTHIAVANTFIDSDYLAFITDGTQTIGPLHSREELAKKLTKLLNQYFGRN
ncbi:MAG: phosphopantothenoylcysteine decarboxylase [Candidatus Omnitrophica bacterium]|nr:phosphopantothenoylcysteine decarboxylase [Candidatus Omnitrophota bacterium]